MLAVGVELDGDVIIMVFSVFVAGLNGAANAEVRNEVDVIIIVVFENDLSAIGGTVINDNIIVACGDDLVYGLFDGSFFVVSGNNEKDA